MAQGDSHSAWAALSHLPRGPFSGPPKTMSMAEMLRDTSSTVDAAAAAAAAAEWGADAAPGPSSAVSSATARAAPGAFMEHRIERRDTLLGLSLKYGVSASELRLANDIPASSDNLFSCGPTLKIPVGPPVPRGGAGSGGSLGAARAQAGERESERATLRRFRVTHNVGEAEAKYYLSACGGDFELATRELQAELEVERRLGSGGGGGAGVRAGTGTGAGGGGGVLLAPPSLPSVAEARPGSGSSAASLAASAAAWLPPSASGEGSGLLAEGGGDEDGVDARGTGCTGAERPGSASIRKRR